MNIPADHNATATAKAFKKGFEAKTEEIKGMGVKDSAEKFDMDYRDINPAAGSESRAFMDGEAEAIRQATPESPKKAKAAKWHKVILKNPINGTLWAVYQLNEGLISEREYCWDARAAFNSEMNINGLFGTQTKIIDGPLPARRIPKAAKVCRNASWARIECIS